MAKLCVATFRDAKEEASTRPAGRGALAACCALITGSIAAILLAISLSTARSMPELSKAAWIFRCKILTAAAMSLYLTRWRRDMPSNAGVERKTASR